MKTSVKKEFEKCMAGNHRLKKILCRNEGYDSQYVVRWCEVCGSIVVDVDYDGRTNAGAVMRMKGPLIVTRRKHVS